MKPALAWTLGAVALAAALASPLVLGAHHIHVLVQILMFAYVSYCWNILGGFAGQLSFGHALFMAVGAYTSTLLLLKLGLSPWLGMIAGGLLAAALGLFIGFLSFRYGIKGTYFSLVTLAFTEIARIVALNTEAIGGAIGLYIPIKSTDFMQLKFVDKSHYYYVMLGFLLLVIAVTAWLEHYVTFIDPNTLLNMSMALEITIYAIVGGVGTLFGPLIGAAFLVPVAETMRASLGQTYAGVHLVVYGAVLMGVILFAPDGLMGLLKSGRIPWFRAQPGSRRPGAVKASAK
jgi:branched-chain amino acid transport system permease protein